MSNKINIFSVISIVCVGAVTMISQWRYGRAIVARLVGVLCTCPLAGSSVSLVVGQFSGVRWLGCGSFDSFVLLVENRCWRFEGLKWSSNLSGNTLLYMPVGHCIRASHWLTAKLIRRDLLGSFRWSMDNNRVVFHRQNISFVLCRSVCRRVIMKITCWP